MENVGFTPVQEQETPKQRPTFLTVLCIFSFIASGILILTYSLLLLMKDFLTENKDKILEENQNEDVAMFFEKFIDNFSVIITYPLLLMVLSIVGVIMMYRLNKIGYYIYSLAHFSLLILSYTATNEISWFGVITTIAFLIMYAVNLKHMN
jgi:hypothetical protein